MVPSGNFLPHAPHRRHGDPNRDRCIARRAQRGFVLARSSLSQRSSPQAPNKTFHRYLNLYGLLDEVSGIRIRRLIDDSHPYIHVDMNRCIYCYRCVRICEEVQGQFVWQVWNRGAETRIVPDREPICVKAPASVAAPASTPARRAPWKIKPFSHSAHPPLGPRQLAPTAVPAAK